jgi:hypothetical protein
MENSSEILYIFKDKIGFGVSSLCNLGFEKTHLNQLQEAEYKYVKQDHVIQFK